MRAFTGTLYLQITVYSYEMYMETDRIAYTRILRTFSFCYVCG